MNNDVSMVALAGFGIGFLIFIWAFALLMIISMWKVFTKAGKPGWACIIPIYSFIVLLEITGKPLWWIILLLIPIVNVVILIMVAHSLSLSFGKDAGFTIGMIILPYIFIPILGFGSATYKGNTITPEIV